MNIDLKSGLHLVTLGYIKKERYTGSGNGIRYYIRKKTPAEGEEGPDTIEVCIWNEPYSFEATPDDEKHYRSFELSSEGLDQALDYIMSLTAADEEEIK